MIQYKVGNSKKNESYIYVVQKKVDKTSFRLYCVFKEQIDHKIDHHAMTKDVYVRNALALFYVTKALD